MPRRKEKEKEKGYINIIGGIQAGLLIGLSARESRDLLSLASWQSG